MKAEQHRGGHYSKVKILSSWLQAELACWGCFIFLGLLVLTQAALEECIGKQVVRQEKAQRANR